MESRGVWRKSKTSCSSFLTTPITPTRKRGFTAAATRHTNRNSDEPSAMRAHSTFEIRIVRPSEHDELRQVRLSALAYTPELARQLAEEEAAPSRFWRDRARKAAEAVSCVTFVAIAEGTFVGVVDGFLTAEGEAVEIGGMWVDPNRRRAGIGHALLAAVCNWARQRGALTATLSVREANTAARLLYERDGFQSVETSTGVAPGVRLAKKL